VRQHCPQTDRKPFAPYAKGFAHRHHRRKSAAFDSYAAYFGTFTIDAKAGTVTHHSKTISSPAAKPPDNVRWFDFQGPTASPHSIEDGKGASSPQRRQLPPPLGAPQ